MTNNTYCCILYLLQNYYKLQKYTIHNDYIYSHIIYIYTYTYIHTCICLVYRIYTLKY